MKSNNDINDVENNYAKVTVRLENMLETIKESL